MSTAASRLYQVDRRERSLIHSERITPISLTRPGPRSPRAAALSVVIAARPRPLVRCRCCWLVGRGTRRSLG